MKNHKLILSELVFFKLIHFRLTVFFWSIKLVEILNVSDEVDEVRRGVTILANIKSV